MLINFRILFLCVLWFSVIAVAVRAEPPATSKQTAAYEWEEITLKAPFAARDGGGAITFKDRMWLIGGWNPRNKKILPPHL